MMSRRHSNTQRANARNRNHKETYKMEKKSLYELMGVVLAVFANLGVVAIALVAAGLS